MEGSIELIEGVLDNVRPPILDFITLKKNEKFTEYKIITNKSSKEKNGENPFVNFLNSFIFCNDTLNIKVPTEEYMHKNGKKKFAYAIGMFPNPKNKQPTYLDGCILAGLGLRRQKTNADIICFITHDISKKDKKKLEVVFDKVIYVPYISPYDMGGEGDLKTIMMDPNIFKNCPNYTKQHPYAHVFFKLNIFNPKLFPYEKVCFVDSDLVPLNYYDSLFMLDCPAGFVEYRKKTPYLESFSWDRCDFLEHGKKIPKELTDVDQPSGADINAGLLLIEPNQKEYDSMIKELTSPLETWMGPNKVHKGFYTFNFDKPNGREFINESYCYPEQNYLTKRFSGKWNYIEFAFQSWSRDPCNSFGIHMAAFNPKPWFKQPCGSIISINKKYNPYSDEWDKKKIRIPVAIKENTKSSYENISYSYEIFNEVIIWGLINYPKLNKFFSRDIEIHGTKVSFDRDVFKNIQGNKKFVKLEDINKDSKIYNKLSISQKTITNILNDYKKYSQKTKNNYRLICKTKKGTTKRNLKIIQYPDYPKNTNNTLLSKEKIPFGKYKGKSIKKLKKSQLRTVLSLDKYKRNKKLQNLVRKYHPDILKKNKSLSGGGKKKLSRKKKVSRKKKLSRKKKVSRKKKLSGKKKCILYYFTMDGCPYCTDFNPVWDSLQENYPQINMKKVERYDDPSLISKFNVSSYPKIILFKDNIPIEFNDNRTPDLFRDFFKKNKLI